MNDYSEYKRVYMCKVISILKVRFPRVRRCHLEQPPPHPVKGKVITVFAPRLHGWLKCWLQVRGLWEDTPHCLDQYQFHCEILKPTFCLASACRRTKATSFKGTFPWLGGREKSLGTRLALRLLEGFSLHVFKNFLARNVYKSSRRGPEHSPEL